MPFTPGAIAATVSRRFSSADGSVKPNILFVLCDQLRADALGCTGNWVRTPNIDQIAREGVRFSNCVTNSPVCIPARVSFATCLYPNNTGVWDNCPYDLRAGTPTCT